MEGLEEAAWDTLHLAETSLSPVPARAPHDIFLRF